jgi:putative DeoR family transcriptional regulator (stage III sporulation protein D)
MTITKGMKINQKIKQRVLAEAKFILETKSTVREAAKEFKVSKSTVHKDMTDRLATINAELFEEVRKHLDHHLEIRHLRGGEATKLLYKGESNSEEVLEKKVG